MGVLTLKIKATILEPMATLVCAKPCLVQEQPLDNFQREKFAR